jgi:transposase
MTKQATEELKKAAARLYQEGHSAREVARALQISHQTVLNVCREAGVSIRPPHLNGTTQTD